MTWDAVCIPVAVGPDTDRVLDGLRSPLSMPDILFVPRMPQGACGGCSMSSRIGMPRMGCMASAVRPHRDRFQKTGLAGVMRRRGLCSFTGESGIGCVVLRVRV